MHVTIRAGVPSDAAALAELAERTFRDAFAVDNHPEDVELHVSRSYGLRHQARELADRAFATLLAESVSGLAGYAQLRRGPAPASITGNSPVELCRFYVAREWHGQGLAQRLMQAAEAEAVTMGARTLWLGVWERNERAKAFYRKCGFSDVGSHVFMVGNDPQTDRVMTKQPASRAGPPG